MKRLYRVLWAALAVCLLLSVGVTGVSAAVDTPYDGYQYDEEDHAVAAPVGYLPRKTVAGRQLEVGSWWTAATAGSSCWMRS